MSQNTEVLKPMMDGVAEVMPAALEQLSRAEVDISIATAKRYPRDVSGAVNKAKAMATLSPEIAEEMSYAIKRDGKVISGPSVRLAEVLLSTWGNLRVASRIIEIGDEFVTAQGVCHDLESNSTASKDVKRRIVNKKGKRFNLDMIQTTANAAASIALRDALFRIIPKAVVEPIRMEARRVAGGDQVDLPTRRAKAIQHFAQWGVDLERILVSLSLSQEEDIGPDEIATLHEFAVSIKDGEATIEDVFPQGSKTEKVLRGGSRTGKTTRAMKGPAPPPGFDEPAAIPAEPESELSDLMNTILEDIQGTDTLDKLANLHGTIANDGTIDSGSQIIITKWVTQRREDLSNA